MKKKNKKKNNISRKYHIQNKQKRTYDINAKVMDGKYIMVNK